MSNDELDQTHKRFKTATSATISFRTETDKDSRQSMIKTIVRNHASSVRQKHGEGSEPEGWEDVLQAPADKLASNPTAGKKNDKNSECA